MTLLARLKPYVKLLLQWLILSGVLFFLGRTLFRHWQDVAQAVTQQSLAAIHWGYLGAALGVTAIAHLWLGAMWGLILRQLQQSVSLTWAIRVYLITNLAKYLPGNVWHFYGRVKATTAEQGATGAIATLSVILESLLMAAAALGVAILSFPSDHWPLQGLALVLILLAVQPRWLNPLIRLASRLKKTRQAPKKLLVYPLLPLAGEGIYIVLRAGGFLLTLAALNALTLQQLPQLTSAFTLAWLLGFVLPGAPGGVGVFEGTLIALLPPDWIAGELLVAIALYRLISTLAEAIGAGGAWLNGRRFMS
ncbi:MAG: lysylphosphatidylglycerol synthase domain-containing protein [Cyanobacteria bacterium P01_G01_bin.54]